MEPDCAAPYPQVPATFPCHLGMARLRVADERPPIWRVAADILNKQSRTADKGWSSILGVGGGADNCSP